MLLQKEESIVTEESENNEREIKRIQRPMPYTTYISSLGAPYRRGKKPSVIFPSPDRVCTTFFKTGEAHLLGEWKGSSFFPPDPFCCCISTSHLSPAYTLSGDLGTHRERVCCQSISETLNESRNRK